jgi:hypothetical protein
MRWRSCIAVAATISMIGLAAPASAWQADLNDETDSLDLTTDGETASSEGETPPTGSGQGSAAVPAGPVREVHIGDFVFGSCAPDEARVDVITTITFPDGSSTSSTDPTCMPWEQLDGEPDLPPLPPVTSGVAGQRLREHLPVPTARMNPSAHAITGLEVWLWYADDGRQTLTGIDHDGDPSTPDRQGFSVTLSDPVNSVTATVWVSEYRWEMGDGTTVRSSRPGSEQDPAGRHTYRRTSSDNTVTAATTWTGTFDWSNRDGAGEDVPLGSITVEGAPVAYPVMQVRAVPAQPDR